MTASLLVCFSWAVFWSQQLDAGATTIQVKVQGDMTARFDPDVRFLLGQTVGVGLATVGFSGCYFHSRMAHGVVMEAQVKIQSIKVLHVEHWCETRGVFWQSPAGSLVGKVG